LPQDTKNKLSSLLKKEEAFLKYYQQKRREYKGSEQKMQALNREY
jgi:hypothetical protein